jgi:glutamate synthase domain-containing protein 2
MQFVITLSDLLISSALLLFATILFAKPAIRFMINIVSDAVTTRLLTDTYTQNLAELFPSVKRLSVLNLLELSLRAQSGEVLLRPLGSPKQFLGYDNLMFAPRQMTRLSLHATTPVDMHVTIGPMAKKPLTIKIPLMIAGMGYGVALSEEAKLALAKASKALQTVTNSGEGPFLPEEPEAAGKYVLQICRWSWGSRTDEQIRCADMLEVQMGQGADMGSAPIKASDLEGKARILGGLAPGETPIALAAPPGINSPEDWPDFMKKLRQRAKDIPIALKIMATDRLEDELAVAVKLGFDAVVLGCSGGGSHACVPIKQDDFGIPSLLALTRATRYLKNTPVNIIIAGGFFTPGQCLKALALGADAIYLGTIPLLALAHKQVIKATPWEPPTTLVYYNSPDKTKLDIKQASTSVTNVLKAMTLEMEEAMRGLGKSSLKELSPDDLVALDSVTADITGIKQAYGRPDIHCRTLHQDRSKEIECREALSQLQRNLSYSRELINCTETALKNLETAGRSAQSKL